MIKLADAKQHLRVDHDDDDAYITRLIAAGRAFMQHDCARNLYDDKIPAEDETGILITPDLESALLLLVGGWYEQRESVTTVSTSEVPLAYWRIVQHYRIYGA